MLPSDLLRARISRGRISPLFCTAKPGGDDGGYELAVQIIGHFADARKRGGSKGELLQEIARLEDGHDYKLVRGLSALLERRSEFGLSQESPPSAAAAGDGRRRQAVAELPSIADPPTIRRRLFEESASGGLALSDSERQDVIRRTADGMNLAADQMEAAMWGDRDENLVIRRFDVIAPEDLIMWYNQSLIQTLLFRCTTMRFHVHGGVHWKRVLRDVKRYGLMYTLEYGGGGGGDGGGDGKPGMTICTLDGPLGLFRMSDRYGTSFAKLLPSITGTPSWGIDGRVTRRTDDGQKTYLFEIASGDVAGLLRLVRDGDDVGGGGGYDSSIEEAFAARFADHFGADGESGWKISREPDPLVADGKAMIPDFVFERFGRRVYFEIVGFWTREYMDRKAAKLRSLLGKGGGGPDLLVAVNAGLACSQLDDIATDRIFTFKNEVPIKPILEHLRRIDAQIVEEKVGSTKIRLDGSHDADLVSVDRVAREHEIPAEAALRILAGLYPKHVVTGTYMVSPARAEAIRDSLEGGGGGAVSGFVEACGVLAKHGIPEQCHAGLLSKLGYEVVWRDLNPDNAEIARR